MWNGLAAVLWKKRSILPLNRRNIWAAPGSWWATICCDHVGMCSPTRWPENHTHTHTHKHKKGNQTNTISTLRSVGRLLTVQLERCSKLPVWQSWHFRGQPTGMNPPCSPAALCAQIQDFCPDVAFYFVLWPFQPLTDKSVMKLSEPSTVKTSTKVCFPFAMATEKLFHLFPWLLCLTLLLLCDFLLPRSGK